MKSLKNFLLRGTALLMVLGTVLPAMAQNNYVFYNANYGYLYNDNGTLRSSTSLRFDKSSAWTAAGAIENTNRTITPYNVANLYLRTSANNGGTVSLNATSSNWQSRNYYLCVRRAVQTIILELQMEHLLLLKTTQPAHTPPILSPYQMARNN